MVSALLAPDKFAGTTGFEPLFGSTVCLHFGHNVSLSEGSRVLFFRYRGVAPLPRGLDLLRFAFGVVSLSYRDSGPWSCCGRLAWEIGLPFRLFPRSQQLVQEFLGPILDGRLLFLGT